MNLLAHEIFCPMVEVKAAAQQGLYDDVLHASVDGVGTTIAPEDFPWVVSALAMVGRGEELEGLFASYPLDSLTNADRSIAHFFRGVAICRTRKFKQARKIFTANFQQYGVRNPQQLTPGQDILAAFYAIQGLAFFRYSTGRLALSLGWSKLAVSMATACRDPFCGTLAHELYGHILCSVGEIQLGIRHLKIAIDKAKALGRGATEETVSSSLLLYECTFGLRTPSDLAAKLGAAVEACSAEDTYLKASLLVQLARLMTLRGDLKRAHDLLDQAGSYVYRTDNPYLEAIYNLALAYLMLQRGDSAMALNLAKNTSRRCRERKHELLQLKALGLESIILRHLNLREESAAIQEEIERLSRRVGHQIPNRILARQLHRTYNGRVGEDRLGDLMDQVKTGSSAAVHEVLESGYHLFLKELLHIGPDRRIIYANLDPRRLTFFDMGGIYHSNANFTNLSIKLIQALHEHSILSKERLSEILWGQSYNPSRHDNLIYSLINRTRKTMGPYGEWLQNDEDGYYLVDGVEFRAFRSVPQETELQQKKIAEPASEAGNVVRLAKPVNNDLANPDLSFRQQQIVALMEAHGRIRAQDVVKQLSVSEATATRDLARLVQIGAAMRQGAGRGTSYVKPGLVGQAPDNGSQGKGE